MQKKPRSIQSLLSFHFVLFALLLLVIIISLVSWVQYRSAREEEFDTLRQISVSVADSAEQQINQMSQITLTAIRSTDMQDVFTSYLSGNDSAYEHNQKRTLLANLMTNARGLDFSIRQLNLYAPAAYSGSIQGYGVGEYNGVLSVSASELPWYDSAREAKGHLVIAGPFSAAEASAGYPASSYAAQNANRPYLSVCRLFYNILHVPAGYVEVRKFYDEVFSLASTPEFSYQAQIYVYDHNGRRLFPADPDSESQIFDYFSYATEETQTLQNDIAKKIEYVSFAGSDNLVVAAVTDRSAFFTQIYQSMLWILISFILLFAAALLMALFFSRRLSSPIRNIYHFLQDQKKDRFEPLTMEKTGIREIDRLTDSINENISATRASTETLMTLKEQEMQAQMLALQSQMNPHFLYNSLSTIGEMAEEGMTAPVARMCEMITEILRYISSNREQRSSLEEELEICDMYLECIRMRYGDALSSSITVPDEMLEILIPKLCIQLLVENAVRSVTTVSPPWNIRIECSIDKMPPQETVNQEAINRETATPEMATWQTENSAGGMLDIWKITVRDNGPGFDPQVDRRLRSQMDYILANGILPSLKIQGMGILNIFIRLYLLDGLPFIFDMGNHPDGGAFVTIGGRIHTVEKSQDPQKNQGDRT